MNLSFENKVALVTGAASGMGLATAICPGSVDTPMVAAMFAKEPEIMKDIMREEPIGRLENRRRSPRLSCGCAAPVRVS